jgi:hypothetical protein
MMVVSWATGAPRAEVRHLFSVIVVPVAAVTAQAVPDGRRDPTECGSVIRLLSLLPEQESLGWIPAPGLANIPV